MPARRFVDADIFINWLKATPKTAVRDEVAAAAGVSGVSLRNRLRDLEGTAEGGDGAESGAG